MVVQLGSGQFQAVVNGEKMVISTGTSSSRPCRIISRHSVAGPISSPGSRAVSFSQSWGWWMMCWVMYPPPAGYCRMNLQPQPAPYTTLPGKLDEVQVIPALKIQNGFGQLFGIAVNYGKCRQKDTGGRSIILPPAA